MSSTKWLSMRCSGSSRVAGSWNTNDNRSPRARRQASASAVRSTPSSMTRPVRSATGGRTPSIGPPERRFPASALSDEPEALAGGHANDHPVHRPDRPPGPTVGDRQAVDARGLEGLRRPVASRWKPAESGGFAPIATPWIERGSSSLGVFGRRKSGGGGGLTAPASAPAAAGAAGAGGTAPASASKPGISPSGDMPAARRRGLRMSLIPSPSSDMPATRATMARPGNSDVHQAPMPTSVMARPMSKPHSAVRNGALTEKAEPGQGQHGVGGVDGEDHRHRLEDVGGHVADDDHPSGAPPSPGRRRRTPPPGRPACGCARPGSTAGCR